MDIKITNLRKNYGTQKAVDNISFEVKKGEILGFLGPNGAGKSTTMKMITSYISLDSGEILLGEKSIKEYSDELRTHIGYLPESNPLYYDMYVMDYLKFSAELQQVPKEKINQKVLDVIKSCGLNKEKHKKIGELSKGYKQRVGLAQAMIHDPEILILDEPTTGLDPNQIIEIRKLIKELGKQKTVILSTHILPEVEATCDRVIIINKGKIVADGSPDSLRSRLHGKELLKIKIEDSKSDDEIIKALKALGNVEKVKSVGTNRFEIESKQNKSSKKDIFNLCVEKGWFISELIPFETRLEDVFRDLTKNNNYEKNMDNN